MQQVIKSSPGVFISKIADEVNTSHLIGSKVTLDFNPILQTVKIAEGEFCLIHLKARPIMNKSLWRWGIYFNENYYSVESWEIIPSTTIKVSSRELIKIDNPNNPPTWVICCENCTVDLNKSLTKLTKATIKPIETTKKK